MGGTAAAVWRMKGVLYLPENHMHWSCFVSEAKRKVVRYFSGEVLKRVTYCGHIKSRTLAVVLIHFALRVRAMNIRHIPRGWCLWPPLPATVCENWMGEGSLNAALCELHVNPLTRNDHSSGRTAPITSKCCILYIYSTNIGTEYFKHGIYSPFFFLFKMQFVS